jgi:hypothetical protein
VLRGCVGPYGVEVSKDVTTRMGNEPDIDRRYAGSVIGIFNAGGDKILLGIADEC